MTSRSLMTHPWEVRLEIILALAKNKWEVI